MDEEPFENFQEQYFEDFDQQQETEQGKYIYWLFLVPITMAEPPKINWISELTIIAKATLIQLARTSVVPRVKSRLKPQKTEIE